MTDRPIYAIGDVHGRADLLHAMLDHVADEAARRGGEPRVMFLGDVVDRGPDSRRAMGLVHETLQRWPGSRLLLGNHDRWFLDVLGGDADVASLWVPQGGLETLRSYGAEGGTLQEAADAIRRDFPGHVAMLETASTIVLDGEFAFVHAGVDPKRPLDAQLERDCLWIREPFLRHVGRLSHVVVHGHTPLDPPRPQVTENRISLDTGACFSGILSALVVEPGGGMSFVATGPGGRVGPVEPVRLDRGHGTVLDRHAA